MPAQVVFTMLTPQDIAEALAAPLAALEVERAILWGSYANGKPHPGSDLDLILIKETDLDENQRKRGITRPLWKALYETSQKHQNVGMQPHPPSLHLFMYTPSEWEQHSLRNTLIYTKATKEGVVIYDKARHSTLVETNGRLRKSGV